MGIFYDIFFCYTMIHIAIWIYTLTNHLFWKIFLATKLLLPSYLFGQIYNFFNFICKCNQIYLIVPTFRRIQPIICKSNYKLVYIIWNKSISSLYVENLIILTIPSLSRKPIYISLSLISNNQPMGKLSIS